MRISLEFDIIFMYIKLDHRRYELAIKQSRPYADKQWQMVL